MTLFEINDQIAFILEHGFGADPETGEVLENGEELMAQLQIAESEKLENVCLFIKNVEADGGAIKKEEESLKKRRVACENKSKRLREYLAYYMAQTDRKKFSSSRCVASLKQSESVNIFDTEALMPYAEQNDMVRYKSPKFDKVAIKTAIKGGATIPGANITVNQSVTIK